MTRSEIQASAACASFDERLEILSAELELAIKWRRPCMLLVVYSSEYLRADVEAALQNLLIDLDQKSVHLSVKNRDPQAVLPFFRELKDPQSTVYLIDGFRWGGGDEGAAYAAASLQREYFVQQQIRAIVWITPNEISKLAHAVPDLWAYRHRVIEFMESPRAEQVLNQTLDSAWLGTGEYAADLDDTDAKIVLRESMLSDLPTGEESVSIRGNLLLTLGVLNWRRGDFEKADEQLQQALQIATRIQDNWFEAECFNAVALVKSSTERIDDAIQAYKRAIELAPNQVFVWNNLGNLCARAGRNDEAMIAFRKALEGNPRDPIAWNGLGGVHSKLGYSDDAIAAFRKALQYTPTFAQPWCGLGDAYASIGRADEALKCYHKAAELNPKYCAPWMRLGVLFTKQERFRDAVKAYQKALALDGKNGDAWNELGLAHLRCEAFDEAAGAFSKAIELDRANGWPYSNLAFAYMEQGKHKEGVSLLLRSIELLESDADKAVSWNRLGNLYRALNDYDNAVAAYQTADQLATGSKASPAEPGTEGEANIEPATNPEEVSWAVALPVQGAEFASFDASETLDGTKPTAKADQPRPNAVETRASDAPQWLFGAAGDMKETPPKRAEGLEKTEALMTGISETGNGGQPAEPSKHAKEAIELTARGNAEFGRGALVEAIKSFNAAIQIDPTYGVPYSNLALTYLSQGQFAEAILLYQKSVELLESDRDRAISWNGLGNAYRCTGDYGNAVAAYQQAAALDPETGGIRDQADNFQPRAAQRSAKGWNNMGELLLKTGALDTAIEAFLKAIEREPGFGRAFLNLARAHAAGGGYGEAVPFYEKSIALLENDKEKAEAWNGLGNAYRKMNDYDKAISAYQKAVVLADEKVDLLTRARFSLLSNVFVNQ